MARYGGWELSDFPENDTDEWKRRLVDVEKEQHTLQAKSDFEKPHLTRTVSALANSRGGGCMKYMPTELSLAISALMRNLMERYSYGTGSCQFKAESVIPNGCGKTSDWPFDGSIAHVATDPPKNSSDGVRRILP